MITTPSGISPGPSSSGPKGTTNRSSGFSPFTAANTGKAWNGGISSGRFTGMYHDEDDRVSERSSTVICSFPRIETQIWKNEGKEERRLRVWPFFYYRQEKEGGEYSYTGRCIIPWTLKGSNETGSPLLSLYEYRRNPGGPANPSFSGDFTSTGRAPCASFTN